MLRWLPVALVALSFVAPDVGPKILAETDLQPLLTVTIGGAPNVLTEWAYERARSMGGHS